MYDDYTVFANADVPAERVKTITAPDRREQGRPRDRPAAVHGQMGLGDSAVQRAIDAPFDPGCELAPIAEKREG